MSPSATPCGAFFVFVVKAMTKNDYTNRAFGVVAVVGLQRRVPPSDNCWLSSPSW